MKSDFESLNWFQSQFSRWKNFNVKTLWVWIKSQHHTRNFLFLLFSIVSSSTHKKNREMNDKHQLLKLITLHHNNSTPTTCGICMKFFTLREQSNKKLQLINNTPQHVWSDEISFSHLVMRCWDVLCGAGVEEHHFTVAEVKRVDDPWWKSINIIFHKNLTLIGIYAQHN